ncbi:hypothetical protein BaRGS_00033380 [Batillaria attramentaria]|uniref:Methyltransferase domain-containing protein n=1 Tax=Batillaria attramentaria TaxID=370345 RepID=A0ABD0JKB7_9CAEN
MSTATLSCVLYICNLKSLPTGPDLCQTFKEHLSPDAATNRTRAWWEWACMIERELDKGEEYKCKDLRIMGDRPVCYDLPFRPRKPCLVYSFGIDFNYVFDDAMASQQDCDVFSFDPSMGEMDHQHAPKVSFKAIGLAARDSNSYQPNLDHYVKDIVTWKVRTLASIRRMLGHENRTLDILKMDIETYEWEVIRDLLASRQLSSVRQLIIEWHIFPDEPYRHRFTDMYRSLLALKRIGFRQVYVNSFDRYHHREYFNSQADVSMVNTQFLKLSTRD